MGIEHRLHQRKPLELMVRLIVSGRVVSVSRTVEISAGGVRIHNPGVALKEGQIIGMDFIKPGTPRQISCCTRAMVIHSASGYIGLMFSDALGVESLVRQSEEIPYVPYAEGSGNASSIS